MEFCIFPSGKCHARVFFYFKEQKLNTNQFGAREGKKSGRLLGWANPGADVALNLLKSDAKRICFRSLKDGLKVNAVLAEGEPEFSSQQLW